MNKRDVLLLAAFLAVVALCGLLVGQLGAKQDDSETEMVRSAVKNAALTCYAVEGAYPQEMEYLTDNYGLLVDSERYIVSYDAFATNIMPDIRVLERGVVQ